MAKIHRLKIVNKKHSGRDSRGHISVRHRGGGHKRFYRRLEWRRSKLDIPAVVAKIEYDPNRSADIALLSYADGQKSYILATSKMKVGDVVVAGPKAPVKDGNCLPLSRIPIGTPICCLEFFPGKGAQIVKSAGTYALIQSLEAGKAVVKLPSGSLRIFDARCQATIGQISRPQHAYQKLKKAGDSRRRGIRPTVRGVAQHPASHPHGGGEGRSPIGMHPKTPWGKPAMGKKTRKRKKASDKLIIQSKK